MYFSASRHGSIKHLDVHRPSPMGRGDKPALQIDIHAPDVYLSWDLTEAAEFHEKLGQALEFAKGVDHETQGTLLSLKFEK